MNIRIKRSKKDVTISQDITLQGRQLNEMRLQDNDTLMLTVNTTLDLETLTKIIGDQGPPDGPGWKGRVAEAVTTEMLKKLGEAGIEIVKGALGG